MKSDKNILLISYVFPPYYGIGGRRWAKHADELTKLGYTVHVICARNPFTKQSLWTDLVSKNSNIILHQISARYPKVLVDFNHNLFQKILYKLFVFILPFFTRGSYLDRSVFWKKGMMKKANEIIKKYDIKKVISTGGPFGVMYFTTLLKKSFKDIFILNDLRDPWTWGPNWGYPNLRGKRMAFEKRREFLTLRDSDIISVTSAHNIDYLNKNYPEFSSKYVLIPHFFDRDEIHVQKKSKSNKIRLILYGTIYHNIEDKLNNAFSFLAKHADKYQLDIFSDNTHHLPWVQKYNCTNVRTFKQIEAKELFSKFKDYDYVFLFNPDYSLNNMSTKFFEIIYSRTPLLLYSEDGFVTKFFEENRLGLQLKNENIDERLIELYTHREKYIYNDKYDVSGFSLESIALSISSILEKGNHISLNRDSIKKVLFTFDYELFLGSRSGTVEKCLIKPTNHVLEILDKYQIKSAIFFLDTIYIKRLEERIEYDAHLKNEYGLIVSQLLRIVNSGHYIYPHIHPHWLDAVYDQNIKQWDLSKVDNYRINSVDNETRKELFEYSVNFIKKIQNAGNISYAIDAYRAGGWCIQPFEDFRPLFDEYGITSDFSVLNDFKMLNGNFYYNFKNFPSRGIYKFDSNIEKEAINGQFTEFSISNIRLTDREKLVNNVFLKVLYKLNYLNFGDGMAVRKTEDYHFIEDLDDKDNLEMVSLELLIITKMDLYRKYTDQNSFIHFITHPKMLTKHNLFCFEQYLKFVTKNYVIETDYKKMKVLEEIADHVS